MKRVINLFIANVLCLYACKKEYSIEGGRTNGPNGAWEFKDSLNKMYTGISTRYLVEDTTYPVRAHMAYAGKATPDADFSIDVFFANSKPTPGTYTSTSGDVEFIYTAATGKLYKAGIFQTQILTENITVIITQISDSSVTGSFSGTALDSSNKVVIIKEGKFTYRKLPAPATVSAGTLGNANDTCSGVIIKGNYKNGIALSANNTVSLSVNISKAGNYTILTDTVKGIYFATSGSFRRTGVQLVTLAAMGTPNDEGIVKFKVRYNNSQCNFSIKIDPDTIPSAVSYFPVSAFSNWSYDIFDQGIVSDTLYVWSTGNTSAFFGNTYHVFKENNGVLIDSSLYRQQAGIYYDANSIHRVFNINDSYATRFMKVNVAAGATWKDTITNVTLPGIIPIKTIITDYEVLSKGMPATVGTFTFSDVLKIKATYQTNDLAVSPSFFIRQVHQKWYAKGVGLIYEERNIYPGQVISSIYKKIKRFEIQ